MLLVGLLLVNAHAAEALRVLTFNLRYINPGDQGEKTWVARRDHVGEVIKKDAADFIGVQEAFRSMMSKLVSLVMQKSAWGEKMAKKKASIRRFYTNRTHGNR